MRPVFAPMATSSTPNPPSLLPAGILGTGRMAQALGALLHARGVGIRAIAGRDSARVAAAASFVHADCAVSIGELSRHARLVLVAVSDHAIPAVAQQLAQTDGLPQVVLHTSGAAGPGVLDPLRAAGVATGVLHPLQTVPSPEKGLESLAGAAYACCGDAAALEQALLLIEVAEGRPLRVDPCQWALYHAASVMACNYQAALLDAALGLMEQAGIGREHALDALRPIVRTTTDNLLAMGPEEALTGPLRRGDTPTVERHLEALKTAPENTRQLYLAAARSTLALARRAGLDDEAARPVAALLEESISA